MARRFSPPDADHNGRLVVEPLPGAACVAVFYIPPPAQLRLAGMDPTQDAQPRAKLLELDNESGRVTIFPINTFGERPDFLKPKYQQVTRITLTGATRVVSPSHNSDAPTPFVRSVTFGSTQKITRRIDDRDISDSPPSEGDIIDILENLPPALTKDYDYGLGLAKQYRFIIEAIESLSDCAEVVISKEHATGIDNEHGRFYVSISDFNELRKSLNRTTSIARDASASVKTATTHNFFADKLGLPTIPVRVGRHPLRQLLTASLESEGTALSSHEQDELLGAIESNAPAISQAQPEKLVALQKEIELVNLKGLIGHFREQMSLRTAESDWQAFFGQNPFILSLAFGYPIVVLQGQASVGGRLLSGRGDRVADFLLKNGMTNNTAIVEIKTPKTRLLNKASYRDGVFTPSSHMSGAVNQVLDQRHEFERGIATLKERSRLYDMETYSVHCCLVIGMMPEDEQRKKSFELFRGNSKSVQIVTFDELYQKLANLYEFLTTTETGETSDGQAFDVPF